MTGPDCLFLDVTGIGVLFGGEEELGGEVVAELKRLGYEVRVAVADTIGAAWASAKYEGRSIKDENGDTFVLCPSSFVLSALRLPTETVDLLSQLGVERLEQLLALPREGLRARFGELLLLRVDQFLGAAQEMIVPYRPPPQFSEEWLLEYPAEQREVVERILRGLVQRVATALANRREGVLKLGCRLDCVPGRPVLLEVGLFRPSADPEHLWDLLQMQLEQATLPGPVGRLRLEATLTAPLENRQGELFAGGEHEAQRQLALLIDRCSSRLGTRAVLRPELTADPLPERGVRYRSTKYEGQRTKGTGRRTKEKGKEGDRFISSFVLRPLSLFSPPQELQVLSVAPDGPPVSFRWKGKTHEVAGSAGPERIETGWWRGRSVRRDYWRVETASGQRFWLFRQLTNGRWFLHGEY
jgi:protein ImuB